MKNLFCLLISISLLTIFGCSSDKSTGPDGHDALVGQWVGYAELVYPGPVDEPVYDTAAITEMNLSKDGSYVIVGSDMPILPMPIPVAELSGTYTISGDSIEFIPDITDRPPREPYSIEGKYAYNLEESELTLTQVLHPELWPETHTIILTDYEFGILFNNQ